MAKSTRVTGMLRIAALLTASALALTACGQADNLEPTDVPEGGEVQPTNETTGGNGAGQATIRFSWWGSDVRHQLNQELIAAFMDQYPDITVVPDFTDWTGYWDKLATQTAGGDTPDVIMMDMNYIREYADRGILANLNEYDIDVADIDEALIGSGEFNDGLWGLPTGGNIVAKMADPQIFEEAGVDLPDDATWTYGEYHDLMVQISQNTPDGVYGAQNIGVGDNEAMVWFRQHGVEFWSEDGTISDEPELLAELWQLGLDLIEDGGSPPASLAIEIHAGGPEQSLVATNRGAVSQFWTNQLAAVSTAAGRDLQLLRFPGETEFDRTGLFVKASMLLSLSATSDYPEEAAFFLDWMQNSTEAGEILLADRGVPANLSVREHVADSLNPSEQQAVAFIEEVSESIVDSPPPPPAGTGEVLTLFSQINEEVLFGQTTPQDAAERFIREANAIIEANR